MAPTTKSFTFASKVIGQEWNDATLEKIQLLISQEFKLPDNVPGGFAKYRSAMPNSFLIKFFFESRSALLGHQVKVNHFTSGRLPVENILRNWKIFMTITMMLIMNSLTIIHLLMSSQLMLLVRIMPRILLTCMSLDNRNISMIFHLPSMKDSSLQSYHRNPMPRNGSLSVDLSLFPISFRSI